MALNLDDAAGLLGVSPATLRRWAREGQLGVRRPSGDYRFDEQQLREWAAEHGLRVAQPSAARRASMPTVARQAEADQPLTAALTLGGGVFDSQATSRDELLAELVAAAPLEASAPREQLLAQLQAREALTSTGLGDGIAVPHPRTPSAAYSSESMIVLGMPAQALDWGALDGKPVHAAFLLINPDPATHLKVLSRLAFVLRDSDFQAALRARASFEELLVAAAGLEPRG